MPLRSMALPAISGLVCSARNAELEHRRLIGALLVAILAFSPRGAFCGAALQPPAGAGSRRRRRLRPSGREIALMSEENLGDIATHRFP